MNAMIVCLFILGSLVAIDASGDDGERQWSYVDKNKFLPNKWFKVKKYCGGNRQSPINIDINSIEYNADLKPVVMKRNLVNMRVKNTGTTVEMSFVNGVKFQFGSQGNTFTTVNMHWHWGSMNNRGSEHSINRKKYPIEGHIVSYDSTEYRDFSKSLNGVNSIYVLGILYEIGAENLALKKVINNLKKIPNYNNGIDMTDINVSEFLPTNLDQYYRYNGSLTTPPCLENVVWTVFSKTVTISEDQLEEFRKLNYGPIEPKGTKMVDNYRPIMSSDSLKLNKKRSVFTSFKNGSVVKMNIFAMSFAILVALFK